MKRKRNTHNLEVKVSKSQVSASRLSWILGILGIIFLASSFLFQRIVLFSTSKNKNLLFFYQSLSAALAWLFVIFVAGAIYYAFLGTERKKSISLASQQANSSKVSIEDEVETFNPLAIVKAIAPQSLQPPKIEGRAEDGVVVEGRISATEESSNKVNSESMGKRPIRFEVDPPKVSKVDSDEELEHEDSSQEETHEDIKPSHPAFEAKLFDDEPLFEEVPNVHQRIEALMDPTNDIERFIS